MFRKVEDFLKAWQYESDMTAKLFGNLTDASLSTQVYADGRDLGFLAWHLTVTVSEMLGLVGLKIDSPHHETIRPKVASEIVSAYETAAQSVAEQVKKTWDDETLLLSDEMYGETWERGMTLFYLIAHQTHHRGQITVLMRQAALPVTGVYGPSKEEWAAMGAPALP